MVVQTVCVKSVMIEIICASAHCWNNWASQLLLLTLLLHMTNKTTEDEQREFIGVYRGLPDVWKVKSDGYKDRIKKDTAYKILVKKMKEIDPHANSVSLRAKINSFRSAYRREVKKVKESMKSVGGTDDVYVPSLWYYDEIEFLTDQETQIQGTSTIDKNEFIKGNNETEVQFSFSCIQIQIHLWRHSNCPYPT